MKSQQLQEIKPRGRVGGIYNPFKGSGDGKFEKYSHMLYNLGVILVTNEAHVRERAKPREIEGCILR
jgi:hypothetical protein